MNNKIIGFDSIHRRKYIYGFTVIIIPEERGLIFRVFSALILYFIFTQTITVIQWYFANQRNGINLTVRSFYLKMHIEGNPDDTCHSITK